jgi:peptidyl-prolyl cis-trans isomerase SurA
MSLSRNYRGSSWAAVLWLAAAFAALSATPSEADAQNQAQLVDHIVAIVGDTIILRSELEEYVLDLQAQRIPIPPPDSPDRPEFMQQALERMVADLLIIVAAEREEIVVGDDEVSQMVDQQLAGIRRQFQTQLQFEQALAGRGLSLVEFRLRLSQRARAQLMARRYLEREVSMVNPVPVSEDEILEVWEVQRTALGPKPATVTLKQVIISTEASETERLAAREEAQQALSRARSGEDFARLAREYSDDPGTRDDGGNLGWQQKGNLVAAFEDALYALQPGEISDIVETSFGFHIIKLERVRGNDRQSRHILIRPEITDADQETARQLADSVARAVRAGVDVDSLIMAYGDPAERATLTRFPQEQLPDYFRLAIEGAGPGDVVGPIELDAPGLPAKFSVVKLIEFSPAGEWTLDDYREVIHQQLEQQKMIDKVVEGLRELTYVEFRMGEYSETR